jgi:flagellar protein FliJ
MKRTLRIAPVQAMFSSDEKGRARELGAAQQKLDAATARLAELRKYHDDYLNSFARQARDGRGVSALRDFQVFLARLNLAVQQQEQIVVQARDDLAAHTSRWQLAARKSKALDTVVGRWQGEERLVDERQDQKQTDERAQRRSAAATRNHQGDH